jgi:hypothetical protein
MKSVTAKYRTKQHNWARGGRTCKRDNNVNDAAKQVRNDHHKAGVRHHNTNTVHHLTSQVSPVGPK